MNASQKIVRNFLVSRETIIKEEVWRDSGLRTTRRYADLMDRFIRSLFLEAKFQERARGANQDALAVVALGGY
ncbi:MAG: hypothetical protein V3W43_17645, partial [Desulfatiglandaceae bacterium]